MKSPFLIASSALFLFLLLFFAREELPAKTQNPNKWKIVFMSTRDRNKEIYVMDLDGKNQRNLTNNPADDEDPYWSPDKKKIIFESDRDGHDQIYSMNPDGTGLKQLTRSREKSFLASMRRGVSPFSPDGKKILFRSLREKEGLYTMNADGTEPKWLASGLDGAWSPDGKWIAYEDKVPLPGMPSEDAGRIFVVRKDGSGNRMVTPITPSVAYNEKDCDATFSPDGEWILFLSSRGPKSDRESDWKNNYVRTPMFHVYMIKPNGSGLKQLTAGSSDEESPRFLDKDRIIFSSNRFVPSRKKDRRLGKQLFVTNMRRGTTMFIHTGLRDSFFEQYVPQKKRILLVAYPKIADLDYRKIFIISEDGRIVKGITNHPGYDGDPRI